VVVLPVVLRFRERMLPRQSINLPSRPTVFHNRRPNSSREVRSGSRRPVQRREIPTVVGATCSSPRHRESLDRDSDAVPFLSRGGSIVIVGSGWSIGRPNVSSGRRKLN